MNCPACNVKLKTIRNVCPKCGIVYGKQKVGKK